MAVRFNKIRVGDEVLVRMLVIEPTPAGHDVIGVRCLDDPDTVQTRWPRERHIVDHFPAKPRPLEAGDTVTRSYARNTRGVILHVIGTRGWVKWTSGQQLVHPLSDLMLVGSAEGVATVAEGEGSREEPNA